jgi:APA family basic amino acid/polyamine antiporter
MIAAVTLTIGWINLRGIRQSAFVINLLTIAKLVPLALFIVVGWWFIDASRLAPSGPVSLTHLSTGALLLIVAFGGYDVIPVAAGEATNPRRHVPIAFVATIIAVTAIMTLVQVVAIGTLLTCRRRRRRSRMPRCCSWVRLVHCSSAQVQWSR